MGMSFILTAICILNFHNFLVAEKPNTPNNTLATYIVHLEPNLQTADVDSFYDSFRPSPSTTSQTDGPRIIYRYRNVFTGFAAKLSEKDVEAMQQKKGFVAAHKERVLPLLTTHSPNFLGLNQNAGLWNTSNYGKGVIIGLLDTGVTPDHPSFSDEGIPTPPQKWKGKCEFKSGKTCNNKLIGARAFGDSDPMDAEGHGTHTTSTAAGNYVQDANIFGLANGTATGMAPLAHVAMYKVCGPDGCYESNIIAGLDAAISDGVDVISMSIGGPPLEYYGDAIAIGAYAAIQKGIFMSCAAGNDGPFDGSVANSAPWILTVGASTQDRAIDVAIVLGNNTEIHGQSGFHSDGWNASTTELELAFPRVTTCDVSDNVFQGKIAVCEMGGYRSGREKGHLVGNTGGAAIILVNTEEYGQITYPESLPVPAAYIGYQDGLVLKAYGKSAKPVASLQFKGTLIGDKNAPIVAQFSSRGPNAVSPGTLKPDILGPGVNILAAWNTAIDNSSTKPAFNMISGTSMSTPHLSGIAALLKSVHPDWSPAAIKSAIITTAQPLNLDRKPIVDQTLTPANAYATGAGLVNPSLASDPGLVYDVKPEEYIPYLCGLNYTGDQVGTIVRQKVDCAKEPKISEPQLNYPSFSIVFGPSSQTYTRTVTNVGEANSEYEVKTESPQGITIKVEPMKLTFTKVGEQKSYNVAFTKSSRDKEKEKYGRGSITWNSAKNVVRSPVGFIFN